MASQLAPSSEEVSHRFQTMQLHHASLIPHSTIVTMAYRLIVSSAIQARLLQQSRLVQTSHLLWASQQCAVPGQLRFPLILNSRAYSESPDTSSLPKDSEPTSTSPLPKDLGSTPASTLPKDSGSTKGSKSPGCDYKT